MNPAEIRNQRILDAVLEKEKALCPGAIALIGIYGSFQTGDLHPLSDLDLLILINDERGWKLGSAFIQEDLGIGHDLYCTDWESLRRDAGYEDPNLAKLMDARIVYCADEKYRSELEALRDQVRQTLAEPFCEADLRKAEGVLNDALHCYALAMLADDLTELRKQAGGVLYFAENAVALLNKRYFRMGVRRRYEELNAMPKRPERLCERIEGIVSAASVPVLKERLTGLVKELSECFAREGQAVRPEPGELDGASLRGSYEEMFSNWKNKMPEAVERKDIFSSFMNLLSLQLMVQDIDGDVELEKLRFMDRFDPEDPARNVQVFDEALAEYHKVYEKLGMTERRFENVDAFVEKYLDAAH